MSNGTQATTKLARCVKIDVETADLNTLFLTLSTDVRVVFVWARQQNEMKTNERKKSLWKLMKNSKRNGRASKEHFTKIKLIQRKPLSRSPRIDLLLAVANSHFTWRIIDLDARFFFQFFLIIFLCTFSKIVFNFFTFELRFWFVLFWYKKTTNWHTNKITESFFISTGNFTRFFSSFSDFSSTKIKRTI